MGKDTVISVEHVSKKYCKSLKRSMLYGAMDIGRNILGLSSKSDRLRKDEFWALNDVSFEVRKGETLGIIGPNGSGKTTLLKLLNGIFWPDKGKITIRGRVGALIELGAGFHPLLTGRENIYINAAILGMGKEEVDKQFDEIVKFADIGDFIDTPVKFYSSGMFVRLGFAVAMYSRPDILLVDEVLAVGDVQFQMKCFSRLKEFRERGNTIIIVTHDMGTIQKHTEKVILLERGLLSCIDIPRNALNQYLSLMSGGIRANQVMSKLRWGTENDSERVKTTKPPSNNTQEDLCPRRFNYNIFEFRYGSGYARIIDFQIVNNRGEEVTSVRSSEVILFRVKVKAYKFVEKPILGISVKTKDGIEIYGNNTLYADIDVPPLKEGKQLLVEYRIHFNLQSGDYFLSAGVAEMTPEGISPLDRRYDLVHITVLPSDKSFGLVNLATDIKVYTK
ncbi:MAG: ABC transporter ATP-binding protein [Syntrophaceae bacterium]|nr:ABC transporter ATP-binding protein [Syntrophaceae bacterium]